MQTVIEDIVKILPKGLVTIPKKMRDELGFDENSLVRVRGEKGRLVVEPVRTLTYPVRRYNQEEVEEFIKLDKKESRLLKRKQLL